MAKTVKLFFFLCMVISMPRVWADVVTVKMDTAIGLVMIEVYPEKAPVTAVNFLRYVDAGKYNGASF